MGSESNDNTLQKLGITADEEMCFANNKGLKLKLSLSLSQVFGISENNLEIGHVQITKYGITMHVVHYVYATDIDELEEALQQPVGASHFCQQLYAGNVIEINQVFREHFMVRSCDFSVFYSKRYPQKDGKSRANVLLSTTTNEDDDDRKSIVLKAVMKKMKTRIPQMHNVDEGLLSSDDDDDSISN